MDVAANFEVLIQQEYAKVTPHMRTLAAAFYDEHAPLVLFSFCSYLDCMAVIDALVKKQKQGDYDIFCTDLLRGFSIKQHLPDSSRELLTVS